jgi:nucleoside-diphosphate-sugar epimerase
VTRVVVTGAGGAIGRVVTASLAGRFDLVPTDVRGPLAHLDVTDGAACRAAFAGADAVLHLAADPSPDAGWESLLPRNVVGTHEVAVAAAAVGVRRLVLASSLQAMSAYPADQQVRPDDPPRPANLYGATKAWAEAVGAWIAASTPTTVVALRIGFFGERPPSGADATPRNLAAWLSHRDAVELVRAAVEGPVDRFAVINGISANRYRKASYGPAEVALGYRPVDDAWDATIGA